MTTDKDLNGILPERIWAGRDKEYGIFAYCHSPQGPCQTEYIRADLCTPAIADGVGVEDALKYFNALWFSIEKHMGVDPDCAHWPDVIRAAILKHKDVFMECM